MITSSPCTSGGTGSAGDARNVDAITESALAREAQRRDDVALLGAASDKRGPAIHHAVPDLPRRSIPRVAGRDQVAGEDVFEGSNLGVAEHGQPPRQMYRTTLTELADASKPGTAGRGGRHTRGRPGNTLAPSPRRGNDEAMRYESSVTSLSWIPSEAVEGSTRMAFDAGFTHYDDPPPGALGDIEELRAADRFRFANVLRAWIEVDDAGRITGGGYDGGGIMGATTLRVGGLSHTFQAVALPDMQRTPEHGEGWMRFVQTTGGRTAIPAPRPVRPRPFIQWQAPLV